MGKSLLYSNEIPVVIFAGESSRLRGDDLYQEAGMGTCFECDTNFDLGEGVEMGDIVKCPKCGFKYEVLNTFPVSLDYVMDEDDEDAP